MRCAATLAMLSILVSGLARAQEQPATPPAGAEPAAAAPAAAAPADAAAAPAVDQGGTKTVEATAVDNGAQPAASSEPAKPVEQGAPTDMERIIVTGVAGAVAVGGLAAGITFGVFAMNDYNCLKDVTACNKSRTDKIEGKKFLDARANVERTALYADMGYLVAATAATVAIVGAVELLLGPEKGAAE